LHCRFLPNPGRYEPYKDLTGNDAPVIEFLEKGKEAGAFLKNVKSIVDQMIVNYQKRNFTDIMIAFRLHRRTAPFGILR
jgi:RNase adaptor protein for sRNA GlmZ degradation